MIKILIAEDQVLLASALAMILNLEEDLEVAGIAENGQEALVLAGKHAPDILLTDIEMPLKSGLEVAAELKDSPIKVMILTTFARDGYFEKAVKASVAAYLLKDTPSDQLIAYIRAAMTGQVYYEPTLVTGYVNRKNPLTKREQTILNLSLAGFTSKEIAEKLYLSHGTIRNYTSEIIQKLAAKNRIEAATYAKNQGWL